MSCYVGQSNRTLKDGGGGNLAIYYEIFQVYFSFHFLIEMFQAKHAEIGVIRLK